MSTERHPDNNEPALRNLGHEALADDQLAETYQAFLEAAKVNEEPFTLTRTQRWAAAGIGACVLVWGINALVQNADNPSPIDPSNTPRPQPSSSVSYQPPISGMGGKGGAVGFRDGE